MMPTAALALVAAVTVGGELRTRLERNFDRMEEEKYRPDKVYLTMEQSWSWPGDTEGRTILALVSDARATGRTPKYLDEILRRLPEKANERGYLGPVFEGQAHEQQLAGNGWLLRGLCEHWLWKRDISSLEAVRRIVRNLYLPLRELYAKYPVDPAKRKKAAGGESGSIAEESDGWSLSTDVGCVFIALDGLVQAWEVMGDDDLKPLIETLVEKFLETDLVGIHAQTHAALSGMRALLRYAAATRSDRLVREVEKRFALYVRYGMTENYENYNWFCAYDKWTETCAVVDSFMVAVRLWQMTDDTKYLDFAHLIYWNGLARLQHHNGGFGLDTAPGDGWKMPELKCHCPEAHWCCTMRGAEGLAFAAESSCIVRGRDAVLACPRTGTFRMKVADGEVAFSSKTDFPFSEGVEIELLGDMPERARLLAYIPFEGMKEVCKGARTGTRVTFNCPLRERTEGPLNPDNALSDACVRRFRGPLLLGTDAQGVERAVYHLMETNVWEKGSGSVRILHPPTAQVERMSLWPKGRIPSVQTNQTYEPFLVWHTPAVLRSGAVLIAVSGGCYMNSDIVGFEVAPIRDFFLERGVTVVTMRYRCPRPVGLAKHTTAWQDAQRTVRLVRREARRRGLDPENIGFTGCSAGGHLSLMAAVSSQTSAYSPVDEVDSVPCHVNWAVPVYPAYGLAVNAEEPNTKSCDDLSVSLAPEFAFDAHTPPMCLVHGDADGWSAMTSVRVYHRLRTMGIPAELHVYAREPHCLMAAPYAGTGAESWKGRVWEWTRAMGFTSAHPSVRADGWTRIGCPNPWSGRLSDFAEFAADTWTKSDYNGFAAVRPGELWIKRRCMRYDLDFEYCLEKPGQTSLFAGGREVWLLADKPRTWNRATVRVRDGQVDVLLNDAKAGTGRTSSAAIDRIGFSGMYDGARPRFRNITIRNFSGTNP